MAELIQPGAGVIFMKVGLHAQEPIDDIIKRKQDEFAKAGVSYWGYGGSTCHPTGMVQPFAKEMAEKQQDVHLVMHKMDSRHQASPEIAQEYSDDGINWYPVPNGIEVRGSRFALVLGGISEEDFDLNLRHALVATGRSRGRLGSEYIQYQVDKGCFVLEEGALVPEPEVTRHIDLSAPLVEPFAVFVR